MPIDYAKRKAQADEARAKLKAHRATLALHAKTAEGNKVTPANTARSALSRKQPEAEKRPPYDGIPMGFRSKPDGYTRALLASDAVTRALPKPWRPE